MMRPQQKEKPQKRRRGRAPLLGTGDRNEKKLDKIAERTRGPRQPATGPRSQGCTPSPAHLHLRTKTKVKVGLSPSLNSWVSSTPDSVPVEPWSERNQDNAAERVEGPRGEGCAVRGLACPVNPATQVDSRSEGDPSELTTRGPHQSEREDGPRETERFSPPLWSNLVFRREG
ncbi:hypothetical protein MG293_007987 [Ovis ammon polii]|uniref:Uncharacterized protein n=1 Tax=Ovis ammon polii TaxID=230172 RepID=A0AAD4YC92_OVIAM|nr:hypothetical protein MG293_007987 [Ovis ammon polii]